MIEIHKNILPEEVNRKIVLYLVNSDRWRIARDVDDDFRLLHNLLDRPGGDFGNSLQTFDEFENKFIDSPLNIFAEIIYMSVKARTKYKFLRPKRYFWNYYNIAANPETHKDRDEDFYVSFVYSLNTCDGGTEIQGKLYPSVSGEAILFPSNLVHRGTAPKNVRSRFNLNCIVELEDQRKLP